MGEQAPTIANGTLIANSSHWVYRRFDEVVKLSKAGGSRDIVNGYESPQKISQYDFVAQPLRYERHHGKLASAWSWIDGGFDPETTAATFARMESVTETFGVEVFDPYSRFETRFSAMGQELEAKLRPYVDRLDLTNIERYEWVSQHGDASFENCINGVLIDFDNAGMYPRGWDRANLHHMSITGRLPIFDDVWPTTDESLEMMKLRWALGISWNFARGVIPADWDRAESFDWN